MTSKLIFCLYLTFSFFIFHVSFINSERILYRIPNKEGIVSNLLQLNNLCYALSQVNNRDELKVVLTPYQSHHHLDVPWVNNNNNKIQQ